MSAVTSDAVLVLNIGSSSIKFAFHPTEPGTKALAAGGIDAIGHTPALRLRSSDGAGRREPLASDLPKDHASLTDWLLRRLPDLCGIGTPAAIGHRVVHGGADFARPIRVDATVLERLAALIPLAPGHQPHNLAGIRAAGRLWPEVPQVACFDTAFHRSQPRLAQLFALPRELADEGILRYGFHGLSYDHVARVLPDLAGRRADGRVVVAHLGHGASMCAMHERRSIATSMGFTALDGLVMGKRCGELDPGVVLHLLRDRGMSLDQVEDLLTRRSGLLGVSGGISDDMRDLLVSDDPRAAEAVDLFCYRAVRRIGSLAAVLGGLDVLVFTGGIGDHAAVIRKRIVDGTAWLGANLDERANEANSTHIHAAGSAIAIHVVKADEEGVIARETLDVLRGASERPPL